MAESQASVIISAVDRVTAPVNRINDKIRSVQKPIGRVRRSLSQLGDATGVKRLTSQFGKLASRIRGVGAGFQQSLGRLSRAGLGVGALGGSLGALVQKTASAGDELAKFSRQAGFSVEQFQSLQFAADRAGVDTNTFKASASALAKRLGELQAGQGRLRSRLQKTNPALLAQLENTQSTDKAMNLLIERMRNMSSASGRNALAAAAFSRQGQAMTRMAEASAEQVGRLRQRARDLGIVISEDTAKASEKFTDRMTDAKAATTGLGRIIGGEFMPVLSRMIERFTDFVAANQDLIRSRAAEWAKRLSQGFKALMDPTSDIRKRLGDVSDILSGAWQRFKSVSELVGGPVNAALVLVGTWIAGPLITAFASLTTSVITLGGAMSGVALRTVPVMLGGLRRMIPSMRTLRAVTLATSLRMGMLSSSTAGAGGKIAAFARRAAALGALSGIGAILGSLATGIKAVSIALISNPIVAIIAGITLAVAGVALAIRKYWEPLTAFVSGVWSGIVDAMRPVIAEIQPLINAVTTVAGVIATALSPVVSAISTVFGGLITTISAVFGWFKNLLDPVDASEKQLAAARDTGASVGRVIGNVLGTALKVVTTPLRLVGFLLGGLADGAKSGASLVTTLASGIVSGVGTVVDAIEGVVDTIASYLPFSDAKRGPLSSLTKSGQSLVTTLAGGMKSVAGTLSSTMSSLWSGTKSVVQSAGSGLVSLTEGVAGQVAKALNVDPEIATETARNALSSLGENAKSVASTIKDSLSSALSGAKSLAGNALSSLGETARGIASQAGSAAQSVASNVGSAASRLTSGIANTARSIGSAITGSGGSQPPAQQVAQAQRPPQIEVPGIRPVAREKAPGNTITNRSTSQSVDNSITIGEINVGGGSGMTEAGVGQAVRQELLREQQRQQQRNRANLF